MFMLQRIHCKKNKTTKNKKKKQALLEKKIMIGKIQKNS